MLVGVGTDGATANVARQNGLRGQMQPALPWLFWSWCYAHRLELACKDAFTSSLFFFARDAPMVGCITSMRNLPKSLVT